MDPAVAATGGQPSQNALPPMDPAELRAIIVWQSALIRSFQDQVEALQSQLQNASTAAPPPLQDPPAPQGTKCPFLLSSLTGRALDWASAVWDTDPQIRTSFTYFTGMIQEVFEYPAGGKDISLQLMELRQGSDSAMDYAIKFRTLAAQSSWNDAALWAVFRESLSPVLQTELACREDATSLSQYVATAIRLDNLLLQHRAGARPPVSSRPRLRPDYTRPREEAPEPMQLGRSQLKEQEHQRRTQMRLCYYCGGLGHLREAFISSAYNLVRIREGDKWKTTFHTTHGHYEYVVMPFGLTNGPAVFQALINEVFQDILGKWVIAYIDDILVYLTSLEEHVHHVRAGLSRLQQNHLYVKPEKCAFHQTTITFLGYVISWQGVKMDLTKVHAVTEWPNPTTIKELPWFLEFAKFYRRFIRNYSSVAGPLTSLLQGKPRRLSWSDQAQAAFVKLKDSFTTAPILLHPDPDLPFVVEVDASSSGFGAVLSQ
ncbi:hypothetical protein QTP70_016964 [Hemibagrus guttatus]|uniref:ribonuclease H n=1 Tax=Hemibagrus guttatus TaxID=175788 RepID=A0AAE0R837_9TELE|nr:hypothetical protein QTP70_016964 [Hemibagrus guttatus]